MSLTLADLQGDLREYFSRIEEVLSGMDAFLAQLETRVARLEGRPDAASQSDAPEALSKRVDRLEGQLAALVDGLYGESDGKEPGGGIVIGR
jgi:hypothetical protein